MGIPRFALSALACFCASAVGFAQEAVPETITRPGASAVEIGGTPGEVYEQLVALGKGVNDLRDFKDNHFLYDEQVARLEERAHLLVGHEVEVPVRVTRVSYHEVIVDVIEPGRARLVLRHGREPEFGNLCTVKQFDGYPSTNWYNQFSGPTALRIGEEIDLEMARSLRRSDRLIIRGPLLSVVVRTKSIFNPVAVATVGDWYVARVETTEANSYVTGP